MLVKMHDQKIMDLLEEENPELVEPFGDCLGSREFDHVRIKDDPELVAEALRRVNRILAGERTFLEIKELISEDDDGFTWLVDVK